MDAPRQTDIMVLASYHEPLAHYRRRGGGYVDDQERHARYFTQATIEQLKAIGVTTVVWPGYKGFGIEHERAEWDNLKPFRKLLECAGLELGVYLQCGSYYAETFYEENPQAREWTALDYWGKPQVYSEYYRCYYRHRPCLTHRAFSEYVARVVRILFDDYGATYLNCDNNAQLPCYTPHFQQAFRQFLKHKYRTDTNEGRSLFVRRYGHPHVDNILLPSGSARRPIEAMHALPDPGLQDWVEFRCRLVAQNAQIITAAARQANPHACLSYNISYDYGEFHQLVWGTEAEFIAPHADIVFSEDGNDPRVTADGRLVSHVHTCKHLRALGRRGNFHTPPTATDPTSRDQALLSVLESAVHNQGSFGHLYANDFALASDDPRPAALQLVRRHKEVFTHNTTVADLGVLRSRHSSTINWLDATQGRLLAQQALYQAGLQWDNVVEATLDQLEGYRLLVLPETISVPGDAVAKIARYVRGGGCVLAVGSSLSCDEWGNRRARTPGASLFGERDASYGSVRAAQYEVDILAAWLGVDESCTHRLFTFPRLVHPRPCVWNPDDSRAPVLNHDYHALPVNHAAFIAAVRGALQGPPVLDVARDSAQPFVIPTLLRSRRNQVLSLHVINYQPQRTVARWTATLHLPELGASRAAHLIRTGNDSVLPLPLTRRGDGVNVTLPPFGAYAGVLFDRQ